LISVFLPYIEEVLRVRYGA